MQSSVNKRLKFVVETLIGRGIVSTEQEIANEIGVSKAKFSDIKVGRTRLSVEVASELRRAYRISYDYLLSGVGSMFTTHPPEPEQGFKPAENSNKEGKVYGKVDGKNTRNLHEAPSHYEQVFKPPEKLQEWVHPETGRTWLVPVMENAVPLLQQRAYGGQPGGFADLSPDEEPEFISLPENYGHGTIAVRVYGESMAPTIHDGDIVVCKQVPEPQEVKDNRVYLVLLLGDGATVKRIINRHERGFLVLKPDNRSHSRPRRVNIDDVVQLYEVKLKVTADLSGPDTLHDRVNDLESLYYDLKEELKRNRKP